MAKKTFVEIQKQIEQLQREADQLRKQEADEVLARIKEAIAVYGFTAVDLGVGRAAAPRGLRKVKAPKRGGKSVGKASGSAPKYRDQDGNVWSGRGPRPGWFKAALEAGKSADDFLV
ncbi:H-NS family nucleoid-associated regulatory protein [Variovorax sp.]|jgi:DNA-binding protein H-NS|uniref:H-NS histone family protein n=1 Tax=Variovorax sp. TaxID=1871043 RepID=UPI0037DA276A